MAKKKYYQDVKDRLAESRGEERSLMGKSKGGSFNGEFHEDASAPSRLPKESVYKNWARPDYNNESLSDSSDTLRGIDEQMDADVRGARKHRSKSKY